MKKMVRTIPAITSNCSVVPKFNGALRLLVHPLNVETSFSEIKGDTEMRYEAIARVV